jgi:hypothetical protein
VSLVGRPLVPFVPLAIMEIYRGEGRVLEADKIFWENSCRVSRRRGLWV